MKRFALITLTVLLALGLMAGTALAEGYPEKPIHMVAHGKAGSGMDNFLRNLGKAMEEKISVPVIVENRVGAGSAKATTYVATSKPNGYVLLGATNTHTITPLTTKTVHSVADMRPVVNLLIDPMVLFTQVDKPWKNIKDILTYAKENPGKLSIGNSQVGSLEYMIVFELQNKGYKVKSVPFQGGAQMVASVAGGHVDVGIAEPSEVDAMVKGGKIKLIGTFTANRLKGFPDVPTAKEGGFDIVVEKFRGILAPKDTPDQVVAKLEKLMKECMDSEVFKRFYTQFNMEPNFMDAKQFGAYLDRVVANNKEYLGSLNLLRKK